MEKLAQGRQDFKGIVEQNLIYVDKTEEIHQLISLPTKYIFFSRPRRFGKSLLISTLKYLFQGEKELFKDLYIDDKYDFEQNPVIHIDFSYGISNRNPEVLRSSIDSTLDEFAKNFEIDLIGDTLERKFSSLILNLYKKTSKRVIILIDEYDKAITDNLTNISIANENREVLREFFSGMKNADQYLRLLFITGVSRFAKVSIFSMLNNISDISLTPKFHNLVGFKPEDIENYFGYYLDLLQEEYKFNREELMEEIQKMYNGYSWDGEQRLYNPYSLTNAFFFNSLENHWFQSGTPTFLLKLIRERKIFIPDLENFKAGLAIPDSANLNDLDLISLLFQTGYLTIDNIKRIGRRKKKIYELKYPNEEVRESMLTHLLADNAGLYTREILPLNVEMFEALEKQDMKIFLNILKSTFSKIPARLHLAVEAYYHSLFYMLLYLMGAEIKLEEEQAIGRVDAVLATENLIYIIEFKFSEEGKMAALLQKAMKQIKEKKYFHPYLSGKKKILLLGVGFLGKKEIDLSLEELKG